MKNERIRKTGGPWGCDWYSICSRHYNYDENCNLCNKGRWINRYKQLVSSLFFKAWPWAWRKWANRKNSPDRKYLESVFPNLKAKKDDDAKV